MTEAMKKMVVDKINELRAKSVENQVANVATNIVQQLDYIKTNEAAARVNIENYRVQIEKLNGTVATPLTAEDIFGKEGK